jgi:hypothetical protein
MAMAFLHRSSYGVSREVFEIQEGLRRVCDPGRSSIRGARSEATGRRCTGESKVFYIDPGSCAKRYTAFNDMREFTHIAWPVVLFQRAQGLRRQVAEFEMIGSRMALEKGLRQQGNIVAMLAQRRELHDHHV